jgi:uncharacterized membrane protein YsdA (DUF1294 family)/cold shock CspA family protein
MRKQGMIVRWDDAKGFGFIRGAGAAQDLFVHVRDYRSLHGAAPRPGLRVSFEEIHVGGKGPRAMAVQPLAEGAGAPRPSAVRPASPPRRQQRRRAPQSGAWFALPLMAAYALALAWLVWDRRIPWWVLPSACVLNLLAFFAYWQDKHAAQHRRWRIREDTLHLWSLAGGWAGAWFAQQMLRHKSAKVSFRITYWATVVLHCAGVAGIWWSLR